MDKYRIMTFDGGGIRGVLTATLLKRLKDEPELSEFINMTKLFAGTSTGSIIALGLAYGLSPEDLVDFYVLYGKYIFTPRYHNYYRPKYDNKHLKEVLSMVFPKNLRLSDLSHKVLVPSFRVTGSYSKPHWGPVFYNNLPGSTNMEALVIDVALASNAAPTFFPSYKHHIDGATIANNPSTAAIAAARGEQRNIGALDDMYLLSIGTGIYPQQITADTTKWGASQWAFYPKPPYPLLQLLFNNDIPVNEFYSSQLLREQYCRLDLEIPKKIGPIPLDAYSKTPTLISLANDLDLEMTIKWIKNNWF
ncbi:patatin-like phospholipase family protein [Vallitalea okinawensis]|uniref:patatin-like phospholipase family protein n=1 Tax=Vallitalea okinawensis TaxID=2078660 RepID=UPI000CFC1FB6|nr:patatin-like phospholipase family protein [Vallitalea okinawensis]